MKKLHKHYLQLLPYRFNNPVKVKAESTGLLPGALAIMLYDEWLSPVYNDDFFFVKEGTVVMIIATGVNITGDWSSPVIVMCSNIILEGPQEFLEIL